MDTPNKIQEFYKKYGHLTKPQPKIIPKTADDRLVESFEEINAFFEKNSRAPQKNSNDFHEEMLARRLLNLRNNPEKREILKDFDRFKLLKLDSTPTSLKDFFSKNKKMFENSIFDTSNLSKKQKVNHKGSPDRRVAIENFEKDYQIIFEEQQALLKAGIRKLKPFKSERQLKVGGFYIYDGMMCFLESLENPERMAGGHIQERTTTIFENGTKSKMFKRSLRQRLFDGNGFEIMDSNPKPSGYIYILKSLSKKDEIQTIKDLYKIGFTTDTVENRIKNAENDPTYLMAPVEIIESFEISSIINPQKIENILHTFFSNAKILMTIIDQTGKEYQPAEWYSVSIKNIHTAIDLLVNNKILNYEYDLKTQRIVKR